jgi:hypothetical protein
MSQIANLHQNQLNKGISEKKLKKSNTIEN